MDFNISKILHSSLLVIDTERSIAFYRDTLGLEVDYSRPDLGFPGAWLNVGDQQIHLLELPNPDPREGRPEHGGRDRHVAMKIDGIEALEEKLQVEGIAYTKSKSGRKALFTRDPDGNALEFVESSS